MTNEYSLIVLFTLGLFSTLHCVGMCGGIISALTLSLDQEIQNNKFKLATYVIAYNIGRISSYIAAGVIIGVVGTTLIDLIGRNSARQFAMMLSAAMMVAIGLYVGGWFPLLSHLDRFGAKLWKRIQPISKQFVPVKRPTQALGYGAVWGWMPCGLVYTALLLSAFGGGAVNGGIGMLAFGLGTIPAVVSAGFIAGSLNQWFHQPLVRQTLGIVLVGFAIMSLAMPMNHGNGNGSNHRTSPAPPGIISFDVPSQMAHADMHTHH